MIQSQRLGWRLSAAAVLWVVLLLARVLELSAYTAWLAALPVAIWCSAPFHRGFWVSLRRGVVGMDALISLSVGGGFLFGTEAIFSPGKTQAGAGPAMLEAVAGLVVMMLLGRWLEVRNQDRAGLAMRRLQGLPPRAARLIKNGVEAMVPAAEVHRGDRILVRPGELLALDGVVEEGTSAMDEAVVTGESLPVEKGAGACVFGGALNKTGVLTVRVTRAAGEAMLAKTAEAVRANRSMKEVGPAIAERAAAVIVPGVLVLGVAAALFWSWRGPEPKVLFGLTALLSILAVACPCAVGVAVPMAVWAGMRRSSELGILFRNEEVLERTGGVDVVLFDKTGTLTEGRPSVAAVAPVSGTSERDLVRWAATAGQRSEHPFCLAVRSRALRNGIAAAPVDSCEFVSGQGIRAQSLGVSVRFGSLAWLRAEGVEIDEPVAAELRSTDESALGVAVDGVFRGALVLADRLRSGARETISRLKEWGCEPILVTGDRNQTAHRIAQEVGIGKVYAEVPPQEKERLVRDFQGRGRRVAMVGSRLDDAPALSLADVGVALAGGADLAVDSADIALADPDLRGLVTAFDFSRRIRRVIRENLAWAFAFNVLLLPVAAGVLYPAFGVMLKPDFAGAAMVLSSAAVVVNSLKLRRFHP